MSSNQIVALVVLGEVLVGVLLFLWLRRKFRREAQCVRLRFNGVKDDQHVDWIFEVERYDGESWLDAAARLAKPFDRVDEVKASFEAGRREGYDEEICAIDALLEHDITPLAREGVTGT